MKIKFDVKTTYEIDIGCTDNIAEAVDYVRVNAIELIENDEAKVVNESVCNILKA